MSLIAYFEACLRYFQKKKNIHYRVQRPGGCVMARAKQDFDGKSQTERHFRRTNISLDLSRKIVCEVRLSDTYSFISIFGLYLFI